MTKLKRAFKSGECWFTKNGEYIYENFWTLIKEETKAFIRKFTDLSSYTSARNKTTVTCVFVNGKEWVEMEHYKALEDQISANNTQLKRMAHWIINTAESELDPEDCQDDCAYQDAQEILGITKSESVEDGE